MFASTAGSALDELLRITPAIDMLVVEEARKAAALLRRLGVLSSEPARAIRPFDRRTTGPTPPVPATEWATTRPIQFDRAES